MKTQKIRELLDEIDEKSREISAGADAWDAGVDQFAMASCDPGIQFELGSQIDGLWEQVREVVAKRGEA